MKKITTAIILMLLALSLTGCGNNIVKKSMEQANTAIESGNYDKALIAIELALDEDRGNEKAKKIYSILEGYQKAQKSLEENNIDKAKKVLDGIDGEYSNYAIKKDIDSLKNKVEKKFKEVEAINNNLTKLKGLIGAKKYDEAKTLIEGINKNLLNEEQKNKVDELSSKINSELAEIEAQKKVEVERKTQVESKKSIYLNMMDSLDTKLSNEFAGLTIGVDIHNATVIEYNAWDNMLNEIWGILKKQLPESEMSTLTKKQVEWISYKENAAKSAAAEFSTGSNAPIAHNYSLIKSTKDRCYKLVNNYMK
jgi:uncharacterized protein YecT (DUF1311 family)